MDAVNRESDEGSGASGRTVSAQLARAPWLGALVLAALPTALAAQVAPTPPDAGRVLQEQAEPPVLPRESPALKIETPPDAETPSGGATVVLAAVQFEGNAALSAALLESKLGRITGRPYDLAGLRGLAERVSQLYRDQGYPFARAYLPPQPLEGGRLTIAIVEGRHGAVRAVGRNPKLVALAQRYLAGLKSGDVIRTEPLERATLLLSDQPGLKVSPVIHPGSAVGTGDLDVYVEGTGRFSGDVGLDNFGNRYTGQHRLRGTLQADSSLLAGDQTIVRGAYSQADLWLGSLSYTLPVGAGGMRAGINIAHTYYGLGKEFSNLLASGTADVQGATWSMPVVRSRRSNATFGLALQHKDLKDRKDLVGLVTKKESLSLPISVQFDHRDGLGQGGVTYGMASLTLGRLHLDPATALQDAYSHFDTQGTWEKWNLDVVRLQRLPRDLVLYARAAVQLAGENLDSSEKFSLGGVNGVRAYPSGEGTGDEGWMVQVELRYPHGRWTPYVFQDLGDARTNANPTALLPQVTHNRRAIGGAGTGLRFVGEHLSAEASLAWRTQGGKALADRIDRTPVTWLSATWKY